MLEASKRKIWGGVNIYKISVKYDLLKGAFTLIKFGHELGLHH